MTAQEKRFKFTVENWNFQPKYRKNIIVDVCHVESPCARTESCYICKCGVPLKEQTKTRYGYQFHQAFNKRHRRRKGWPAYFTGHICSQCWGKLEERLGYEFYKSYAP